MHLPIAREERSLSMAAGLPSELEMRYSFCLRVDEVVTVASRFNSSSCRVFARGEPFQLIVGRSTRHGTRASPTVKST